MMNRQESIQLLEEMGLDENYRCPSCNEILIHKIRKSENKDGVQTVYRCSHCGMYFRVINCRVCHKKRYASKLNICSECFKNIRLSKLTDISNKISRNYNKLLLITSRKKPDIIVHLPDRVYRKLAVRALDMNVSKADICRKILENGLIKSQSPKSDMHG